MAVAERNKELKVPSFYSKDEEGDIVADDTMERTFRHMRLASWAHLHPTEFYKIYSKLLPSQAQHEFGGKDGVLRIVHSIAPGALDTAPESLRGGQIIEHENDGNQKTDAI